MIIALTASGFGLAGAATAVASPWNGGQLQINVGRGWTSHASAPLFAMRTIEPGWSDTARLGIRNASVQSGALTIAATHVSEKAGCASGAGCRGDRRRLGQDLRFTVFLERGSSHDSDRIPLWTGALDDLRSPVSLARRMPTGATWHLRIDANLPSATGNDAQDAQLSFNVVLRLQGQAAEVLGIHTARGESAGGHGLSSLPFTGEPLVPLLAGACLLLVAGVALVRVGRSRWAR